MTRTVTCCLSIFASWAFSACAPDEPAADLAGSVIDRSASGVGVDSQHPSTWSCQRWGDVADETSDSYDSNAARRVESYLFDTVADALGERGISVDRDGPIPERWISLLAEICIESPDLNLEAAASRVADGLP